MTQKTILILILSILALSCNNNKVSKEEGNNEENIQPYLENTILEENIPLNYMDIILKELNLDKEDCYNELLIEATLPYDKEKSVIIIPIIERQEDDFIEMNVQIVVFDHMAQKIICRNVEREVWVSEGVFKLSSVEIDTTPYKLNSSSTAFGIKKSYRGSSQVYPYYSSSLTLFMPQGEKLKKVLNRYTIFNFRGETNTMCEGLFENEEVSLSISNEQTNGYYNIIASKIYKKSEKVAIDGDCVENILEEKEETEIIYFENEEYKFKRPEPGNE